MAEPTPNSASTTPTRSLSRFPEHNPAYPIAYVPQHTNEPTGGIASRDPNYLPPSQPVSKSSYIGQAFSSSGNTSFTSSGTIHGREATAYQSGLPNVSGNPLFPSSYHTFIPNASGSSKGSGASGNAKRPQSPSTGLTRNGSRMLTETGGLSAGVDQFGMQGGRGGGWGAGGSLTTNNGIGSGSGAGAGVSTSGDGNYFGPLKSRTQAGFVMEGAGQGAFTIINGGGGGFGMQGGSVSSFGQSGPSLQAPLVGKGWTTRNTSGRLGMGGGVFLQGPPGIEMGTMSLGGVGPSGVMVGGTGARSIFGPIEVIARPWVADFLASIQYSTLTDYYIDYVFNGRLTRELGVPGSALEAVCQGLRMVLGKRHPENILISFPSHSALDNALDLFFDMFARPLWQDIQTRLMAEQLEEQKALAAAEKKKREELSQRQTGLEAAFWASERAALVREYERGAYEEALREFSEGNHPPLPPSMEEEGRRKNDEDLKAWMAETGGINK